MRFRQCCCQDKVKGQNCKLATFQENQANFPKLIFCHNNDKMSTLKCRKRKVINFELQYRENDNT